MVDLNYTNIIFTCKSKTEKNINKVEMPHARFCWIVIKNFIKLSKNITIVTEIIAAMLLFIFLNY